MGGSCIRIGGEGRRRGVGGEWEWEGRGGFCERRGLCGG